MLRYTANFIQKNSTACKVYPFCAADAHDATKKVQAFREIYGAELDMLSVVDGNGRHVATLMVCGY